MVERCVKGRQEGGVEKKPGGRGHVVCMGRKRVMWEGDKVPPQTCVSVCVCVQRCVQACAYLLSCLLIHAGV